ncbi:MAG TPA: SBBP repeat-containing protein, partial [Verrucomicrobiae bacterium]|nr:SBBP repeat-containing protein [Verrucomicrobiae bacterium]
MNRGLKKILSAGFAAALVALAASAQTAMPFGGLPLYFETNHGQTDPSMPFLARGRDSRFLISPAEARIVLRSAAGPATVRMQFVGANPRAHVHGAAELPGKINYLTGNDPAHWHTGLPLFAKVRVEEMYPGIGLVYYGNEEHLEYDFEIAPGANPDAIRIHFDGVDKIAVTPQGGLVLSLNGGEIQQLRPVLYQTVNGVRREIAGGYRLADAHTVAFSVGSYDHSQTLVIDPVLSFSTYFGGNSGDIAWAVKLDTNGFVYIAGQTFSSQFANNVPLSTPGVFQPNYQGGSLAGDAFVAKFDHSGQNLIYFTYLGGSDDDVAYALAVDAAGHAYVAGATDSTNFPVVNAIPGGTNIGGTFNQYARAYLSDAFVAELDGDGANLIYSTYLGGSAADAAYGIALDSSNDAYVTGFTYSTNFPTSTNAFQKQLAATNSAFSSYFYANAFITEISAGGGTLLYSTFFGGTNYDAGRGIAVDGSNYVYVTGFTDSTNFPTTNAIYQVLYQTDFPGTTNQVVLTNLVNGSLLNGAMTNMGNAFDAFVIKFAPSFSELVYSTFLGGTNNDQAYAIAADNNGNAYVTGWTVSTNFPNTVTITNLQNGLTNNLTYGYAVVTNVFLTQITNGTSAGIGYSAVFGGTSFAIDVGYGVALDPAGNVFVTGGTSSTNFPVLNVPGYLRATNSGNSDAFVTAFNTNATALLYSGYLGGSENDFGYAIAVDTNSAYIVGQTVSTDFPTLNALHSTLNGTNDAFLAAIMLVVPPPDLFTNQEPISQTNAVGSTVEFSINGTAIAPYFIQWLFNGSPLTNGTQNGANISGATNAQLVISNLQLTNAGIYSVVVTNNGGATNSLPATLGVT